MESDKKTYEEIIRYLYDLPKVTKKNHLDNTRRFLDLLGNPQERFQYIHVAGTNGKGSVCAYLDKCIRLCHKKTGLFTSPHLVRINERFRISGKEISDEEFVTVYYKVWNTFKEHEADGLAHPSYFEFLYIMAMVYFKDQGIAYGIVEAGIGGRYDHTNAIRQPALTIITSVSRDHMSIIGNGIEDIAYEKAGIIKAGCPLIFDQSNVKAAAVILKEASTLSAPTETFAPEMIKILRDDSKSIDFLLEYGYDKIYALTVNTAAVYQTCNSSLALLALKVLWPGMGSPAGDFMQVVTKGLSTTYWPGRMEAVLPGVYIDGAHNEAGIDAFIQTVERSFRGADIYLIFAVAGDKDYQDMIRRLCGLPGLKGVIVTEIDNKRRVNAEDILGIFRKDWHGMIRSTYNIKEALRLGLNLVKDNSLLFCVGSLYLAGSVKEILGGERSDQL